ncbi:SDR family oxidoreductase [Fodinibius sediminis]|uniref:NAD(P)-dependent dehydrogenase, short-chain alcohol dehydrogenase family n=1 Tax=Fodinibius sediminis TaxID=1214077 RepID=A0A521EV87_9BACT|nr:SDR family oxidoreductase [Fodinibius sediminis]SMO87846.1 NAD(P)-dependent dehydrogenase, short-chain alcohol dehydrogenase family [Fodinibius sediminis]
MRKHYELRVDSKVVLVTGGYGYLGKAIVKSLSGHGATVYVLGRNKQKFQNSFNEVPSKEIYFQQCDVSETSSIRQALEIVSTSEGVIDVLINNAFYSAGQSPESMTDEEWTIGIDGTLSSVFRCIREIIPYFKKQKYGNIINVSSMYGMIAPNFDVYEETPQFLNPPNYGAAKAGILQLSRYYASYLGKYKVTVNSVTPGAFPSDEVQKNDGFINNLSKQTFLGRIGQPEDLAGLFTFLSSDAANYITGQNFVVDGGWTTK